MAASMASSHVGPSFSPRHPHLHRHLSLKNVLVREKDPHQNPNPKKEPSLMKPSHEILDRWAARQAREMITTIHRRAHEAELTACCSTPVSARAANFIRDTSPSSSSSAMWEGSNVDVRPNVRASSLIQMWREMEAESGGGGGGGASGPGTPRPTMLTRENSAGSEKGGSFGLVRVRCRREMEDFVDRMTKEREREVSELGKMEKVSRFSNRGRIQSMLKLRFLRKDLAFQNEARPASRKMASKQSQGGVTILFLRERFDKLNQSDTAVPVMEIESNTVNVQLPIDSQDSCSSHSSDQLSVDNNQYQEVISIEDPEIPPEAISPQSRSDDLHDENQTAELNNEVNQGHDPNGRIQSPESNLLHFTSDLHDADASWDERNLWESNLDWQRSMESPNAQVWQSESEIEPYTPQDIVSTGHIWTGNSLVPWRGWGINTQEYYDYFETFSDNIEIRELLERRRVTTSLASDFCDKMNRMIVTVLHKQGQQSADDNFGKDYGEQPTWQNNYNFNNVDQGASNSSLVPSSCQTMHYPDSWQHTPLAHQSSQNLQALETVQDLKSEIAEMHQEISDLKKLLKSCMEWQSKIQEYIKEEVSSAINQSVLIAKTSEESKGRKDQKGNCCICHETQVDSLLYRCGHMCTCFKCAHELQWKNGTCPICHDTIVDVVRPFPNT